MMSDQSKSHERNSSDEEGPDGPRQEGPRAGERSARASRYLPSEDQDTGRKVHDAPWTTAGIRSKRPLGTSGTPGDGEHWTVFTGSFGSSECRRVSVERSTEKGVCGRRLCRPSLERDNSPRRFGARPRNDNDPSFHPDLTAN